MDTRGIAEERRKVWIDVNSLLMCDSLKKIPKITTKTHLFSLRILMILLTDLLSM